MSQHPNQYPLHLAENTPGQGRRPAGQRPGRRGGLDAPQAATLDASQAATPRRATP